MTSRHDIAGKSNGTGRHADRSAPSALPLPDKRFFGYKFRDPKLLALALTHSSLAYESNSEHVHEAGTDNEQLEFIGDAVLGLVVAEALFRRFPGSREGDLTRLRASLVSSRNLAMVASRLDLGTLLRLGRGEEHSGGRKKPALLANALEAVIAAIYLDGGPDPAREFIHKHIIEPAEPELDNVLHTPGPFSGAVGDYKSALQERLQATGAGQPKYILTDSSGPDHRKHFRIEVRISDSNGGYVTLAEADGSTKKQAQQEAARRALESLISGALHRLTEASGSIAATAAEASA